MKLVVSVIGDEDAFLIMLSPQALVVGETVRTPVVSKLTIERSPSVKPEKLLM